MAQPRVPARLFPLHPVIYATRYRIGCGYRAEQVTPQQGRPRQGGDLGSKTIIREPKRFQPWVYDQRETEVLSRCVGTGSETVWGS